MNPGDGNGEDRSAKASGPDASVIVGALYALAADLTEWERLPEAVTANPADAAEQPRPSAMAAGGEKVAPLTHEARLAHEFNESAQPAVWIIPSADRGVAANAQAASSPLDAPLSDAGAVSRPLLRPQRTREPDLREPPPPAETLPRQDLAAARFARRRAGRRQRGGMRGASEDLQGL